MVGVVVGVVVVVEVVVVVGLEKTMFINLHKPQFIDISQTTDRVHIRLREKEMPGRLWLSLTFETWAEAKALSDTLAAAIARGPQPWTGRPQPKLIDVGEVEIDNAKSK